MTDENNEHESTPAKKNDGGLDEIALYLGTDRIDEVSDPDAVAKAIVQRILDATDVDSILGGQQVLSAEDLMSQNLEVTAVHFNRSALNEGPGVYAVVEAKKMADGEPVTFSIGARSAMAQLYRLQELGALPVQVQLARSYKPTASGFYPMWFEPAKDF